MSRVCALGVFNTQGLRIVHAVDGRAPLKVGDADVFLTHCSGTDYIESVSGRLGCEKVFVFVFDEAGMAIATGKIATPEFLSLWHQRNPIRVESFGPDGRHFGLKIITTSRPQVDACALPGSFIADSEVFDAAEGCNFRGDPVIVQGNHPEGEA